MSFLAFALMVLSSPFAPVNNTGSGFVYTVGEVSVTEISSGLHAVSADGFNLSGDDGTMLPWREVMLPVPPGEEVSVTVIPSGIHSLGSLPSVARSVFTDQTEQFEAAPVAGLQDTWGHVVEQGTFRRAGFVSVRLNPVIVSSGELLAAEELTVHLDLPRSSPPETVRGHEGEILQAVLGTSSVWRETAERTDESPFWGKPWARIEVDTAGVFQITGEMVPEAVGMPSASLAMITGRGRTMSTLDPEADAFVPREVPILVQDGGDGTFDETDRVIFYGRGIAWWGELRGDHFNGMYDSLNTYWFTWGGEGGPFMEVVDGSITGAPSIGESYLGRLHMEQNQTLAANGTSFDDNYGWHRISSSATASYSFYTRGTTGDGYVTMRVYAGETDNSALIDMDLTASVNGTVFADTSLRDSSAMECVWTFPVSGLKTSANQLSLQVRINTSMTFLCTDWFEVFPETKYQTTYSQCQVPLERTFPAGERRQISWSENLSDQSFVCVALSDTAVVAIDLPEGKDFEFTMPDGWAEPVMWVVPNGELLEPVSVSSAAPGRILGTISSGSVAYIYPEVFAPTMPLFQRGRPDALLIPIQEIYDEFNGGVRDPSAVRAFFGHTVRSWSEPLDQLIMVGDGHWDPRNFISDPVCFMDMIVSGWEGHPTASDLRYTTLQSSSLPQGAVSRLPVTSRTELQLIAQRSSDYSDISQQAGTWQSLVLGSADDERSAVNPDFDETIHTAATENILSGLPDFLVPVKNYLIFYDWNSNWKKPESRTDLIEKWSDGALVMFFLGHGSFDQIADEGLMFLEDVNLMACGPRLPWAFFGSCNVGQFQNPYSKCISENLTMVPEGGAIVASGCTSLSGGYTNPSYLADILDYLLFDRNLSMGECQWLGTIATGASRGSLNYIVFGDGTLYLALPDSGITVEEPILHTSQFASINGEIRDPGILMVTAWESAQPDSYYTHLQNRLIEYLTIPGVFYRGLVQAEPEFTLNMFVPEVASTGPNARIRYFDPAAEQGLLHCSYPLRLEFGQGSPDDSTGPDAEIWLQGFRGVEHPSVSGEAVFQALLSDQSGINLLPYPGNQLALYIDDTPVDVAEFFTYEPGSATQGQLIYTLPDLQPGDHQLKLRAADNVSNISWTEMTFHLQESEDAEFTDFFVYPTPAVNMMSFNWVQSAPDLVNISIFTVTGRKIAEMGNLSCSAGYNQHVWDLRDIDGDAVAAGTYIYVVSAGETELSGIATIAR